MREPQEIQDEAHEQVAERVAAVDVAKASGMVCTRVPHPSQPGRRLTKVWEAAATTGAITELGEHLAGRGAETVTVESTSDYWRAFVYLLAAAGLEVQLVNARDVKNVPGRPKTDKLDAVWLAKLTERGMLRPSFVPPAELGWPGGAAGQRPRRQERPGPAQDRQARCGLAGQADRAGHAAAQLCSPGRARLAWRCSWSTPATSRTSRAGPRPTSSMRSGWPS